MTKPPRRITAVDRMLGWDDGVRRALKLPIDHSRDRRRTHRRFGGLDVIVVEKTDEPTVVYLTNDEDVIIEASAEELIKAAEAVKQILAQPPPAKRGKK